jgi:phosphoserine aminotransferase
MYNTPNTFGIWVIGLVADWVLSLGGLDAMAARNQKKATLLYETLDQLSGYETVADNDARSLMNVTFKMESPEADKAFVVEADRRGIVGLKGHRSVGGLRASIYNAVEHTCVEALCQLLRDMN